MEIKVGMLIPRSYTLPLFTQQVVRGIKQGFETAGVSAQYSVEDIGKGVDPDLVMSKANNLLLNEVDIIFAMAGTKVDIPLVNLCAASQKPLINIDAGVSIIRNEELPFSEFVYNNSYEMWQACLLLGKYAAEFCGKKALITEALFESGYSFLPAFDRGYSELGGKIAGIHICRDFKPEDFTVNLAGLINETQPDIVVAFYNGKDAEDFYNYAVKTGVTKNIPIVTTSLAAGFFKDNSAPLTSAVIWDSENKHSGNKLFVESYLAKYKTKPDEYAAIAYESALTAATAIKKMEGDFFDPTFFCNVLKETTVEGPRGTFRFNPGNQKSIEFPTTIATNKNTTEVKLAPDEVEKIKQYFGQWPHSGWFNPYPCA